MSNLPRPNNTRYGKDSETLADKIMGFLASFVTTKPSPHKHSKLR